MKKYEVLEHPADLKIKVFGRTKEELFLNALFGMQDCLRPESKKSEEKTGRKIKTKSPDLPTLLVDFLSEILYLSQVNKEIYNEVKFLKFSDTEIEAQIFGQKVERFNEDIKAVTYHQLDIYQRKDGIWEAIILFDI